MKRIIVMVLKNILFVPYWALQLLMYARENDKHTEQQRYDLLRKIVLHANKGGKVKIESSGLENIPKKNGFIMYPNHQGLFDMLAIIEGCEQPLSVVMKKEVANIPFIKQVRKIMKAQSMDREDVRQSMKVIIQITKEVSEGRNYVIFAEGTRSKKGNELLDFKGGSFKAATKAKCPIIPVALIDSFVPFDSDTIKEATVKVHYLSPITYEEYKSMKTNEIAALVKERIKKEIEKSFEESNCVLQQILS